MQTINSPKKKNKNKNKTIHSHDTHSHKWLDLDELPVKDSFVNFETGYGIVNKTGWKTHNSEKQEYNAKFKHGDIVTVELDLLAQALTFYVNGKSRGLAYDQIPRGAYRLACKVCDVT